MRQAQIRIMVVVLCWIGGAATVKAQSSNDTPADDTGQASGEVVTPETDEAAKSSTTGEASAEQSAAEPNKDDTVAEPFTNPSEQSLIDGPASSEASASSLSLKQAQEKALANYPQFQNINEAIYQADLGIYQAWTMLLPNLTADGNITLNQAEVAMDVPLGQDPTTGDPLPPMHLVIQDKWAKTFGFAANLTLFNPQTIPLIKMAYDTYEKQQLTAQIQRNELLFAVTSAFYQAYAMKEMIRVAEESVATSEEFLRHATILKNAGQGTQIDVNRAELQLIAAQKEVTDAKSAEENALLALKQLINDDDIFNLEGPGNVNQIDASVKTLKSDALEKRIELKEAALNEKLADRNRQHTLTKFLPTFDLTYTWSWASAEGFSGSNTTWMLIFGAKWNILLGGSRLVEYKSKQSQIQMAKNNVIQITHDIESEVEQRHAEIEQRKKTLEILDRQVTLSEENHDLVSKQYQAGIVSSLDVTTAATELSSKKIMRVYERLLFDLSVLKLRKAVGEYSSLAFVQPDSQSPLRRKF